MRDLSVRHYVILTVAFVFGLVIALANNHMANADSADACVTSNCQTVKTVSVFPRAYRLARPFPQPVIVQEYHMANLGVYKTAPVVRYEVKSQPQAPIPVRGLFRDRLVFPRRPNLTVETIQ